MKKIFNILFPIFDWLYILQTLEYSSGNFGRWIIKNLLKRDLQKKKSLIFTPKIIVILLLSLFMMLLNLSLAIAVFSLFFHPNTLIIAIQLLIFIQIFFIYVWASNYLLDPLNDLIKTYYVSKASTKLDHHQKLIVIGVTGSYGKTSTKEILHQILSTKYKVLKTPSSYNTAVGVANVVLKELKNDHEIFIVEMGAYKKGEIKKICELTKPHIGIITGLNEQHLDRFKTIENTLKAKTELIEALPSNSVIALNFDNSYLRYYYNQNLRNQKKLKVIPYAVNEQVSWKAENIKVKIVADEIITSFELKIGEKQLKVETKLLGKHNILNIMGALAIAKQLKINPTDFKNIVQKLEASEHRLQLVPTNNGIMVIDDAYSANPSGFEAALDFLSELNDKRKIIVTPGIVELGNKEFEIHNKLGEKMGNICDYAILIGKQSGNNRIRGLLAGIEKSKFNKENLFTVDSLKEAQEKITKIVKIGDVILFENDLPDQY
ncbi:hypothetical protein A2X44_01045 [candidate division CPR3 bacterium GWF2_35_18]|uniref:UDP-N-acetylmuramoyl-tripeptide-D-alanyl-D-alanine ligase n=1 Tax=candidate division CPR3 bacterium GW2011_GWF2_35_18 TaxID=1618350 RepID=A0A0G0BLH6_UNCC3|nr:MAG: UDP-N-acetylmuramoyl-tripeptide-D-alanyl-D-alanine ligase [candidate division CPR3 bacterium GW2011_GWF2_35_18]KKP86093.1 MAG: UDP-N-acetylmuramoyl-tripeptide-D-alanyl-D-alanine ligase [candidate division CPR3 bacterium GW2011_GWE2_35_7]OGB63488.1 MAG: hypothetical protein A2X44_01045 [candidate division CPR3 bacterium GWF2_35_18]OGB64767.1 MAG: hypothetical protein A2250_04980 [candidate division CPR3 bacterium RIFOXYA2_FULL_35_13]OGB77285.1 MAG: hypothetical protein A2476_03940 [candi